MSLLHGRLISSRYYVRSGRDNRHIMSGNYETLSCESLFLISASSPDIPLEVWKAWKLLQPLLLFPFKLSTKQWLKCCSVLCILLRKNSMLSHGDIYSAFKNTVSVPESKYFTALTAPTHAPGSKYRTHKRGYFCTVTVEHQTFPILIRQTPRAFSSTESITESTKCF